MHSVFIVLVETSKKISGELTLDPSENPNPFYDILKLELKHCWNIFYENNNVNCNKIIKNFKKK